MSWVAPVASLLGNIFTGIFGFKRDQANIMSESLQIFEHVQNADQAYFAASASAINSVYAQGSWIDKNWRPSLMWVCITLLVARWFLGYQPPGMSPAEIEHMYTFIYIGLGGYVPLRSMDKWMQGFQIGRLLKHFIEKKLL